jgi:hypothetical protein
MVRIRSEHAIGFLKGRWHSLKHLRVRIADERSHKFATYWIAACVGLHAFAMQCEEDERMDGDGSEYEDPFIAEGLSSSSSDDDGDNAPPLRRPSQNANLQRLRVAKARREKLKRALFRAKDRRRQRREQDQASTESPTDSSD